MALSKSAIIKLILEHIGGAKLMQARTVKADGQKVAIKAAGGLGALSQLKSIAEGKIGGVFPDLGKILPTEIKDVVGEVSQISDLKDKLFDNPVASVVSQVKTQATDALAQVPSMSNLSTEQKTALTTSLSGFSNAVSTFETHTNILSGLEEGNLESESGISANTVNDLIANNAIILGKANTSDLAGLAGNSHVYGVFAQNTYVNGQLLLIDTALGTKANSAWVTSTFAQNSAIIAYVDDAVTAATGGGVSNTYLQATFIQNTAAYGVFAQNVYVNTELAKYTNTANLNTALALKADNTYVNTELAKYTNTANLTTSLNAKADNTYVNTELAKYTNTANLTTLLNAKADNTYVNTELAKYTNTANLTTSLNAKADNTYVNTELAKYTNTANLNTALALKGALAGNQTWTGYNIFNNINGLEVTGGSGVGALFVRGIEGGSLGFGNATSEVSRFLGSNTGGITADVQTSFNVGNYNTGAVWAVANSTTFQANVAAFHLNSGSSVANVTLQVATNGGVTITPRNTTFGVLGELSWSGTGLGYFGSYGGNVEIESTDKILLESGTGVNVAGGKLVIVSSSTARASLNMPHGTAPTSPANGDVWTTTSGLFVRVAGATVGPLAAATSSGGSLTITPTGNVAATTIQGAIAELDSEKADAATFAATYSTNTYVNTQLGLKANLAGDTFTGRINAVASDTAKASLRLPHGAAPTTPANGDIWTTTTGLFAQVASATHQFANITYAASNTTVYSTFAQNTAVYSTFAQNTYVNTELAKYTNTANMTTLLNAKADNTYLTSTYTNTASLTTLLSAKADKTGSIVSANNLMRQDTRSVDDAPSAFLDVTGNAVRYDFKTASTVSSPVSDGGFTGVLTLAQWTDASGGHPSQLAVSGGAVAVRSATSTTVWGSWSVLASNTYVNSTFAANSYVNTELAKYTNTANLTTSLNAKADNTAFTSSTQGVVPNPSSATGKVLRDSGWTTEYMTAIFVIDGGGATITTGVKGDIHFDGISGVIESWTLLADQSGSIVVDIWKDTYANAPPVVGDVITASAKPTISSSTKGQSSTLTGWTTTVSDGDVLRFNVNSVTTIQRVTLSLKIRKT